MKTSGEDQHPQLPYNTDQQNMPISSERHTFIQQYQQSLHHQHSCQHINWPIKLGIGLLVIIGALFYFSIIDTSLFFEFFQQHEQMQSNKIISQSQYEPTLQQNQDSTLSQYAGRIEAMPKQNQQYFNIPKHVWIYRSKPSQGFYPEYKFQNIQYYANLSQFEVRQFNQTNIGKWISQQQKIKLDALLTQLQNSQFNQMKYQLEKVKQNIMMLTLLQQLGGVYIHNQFIFTQSLEWLYNISDNIHVNAANQDTKPQVFGFMSVNQDIGIQKHHKKCKADCQVVKNPILRQYFIAALAKTAYISDLLTMYIQFVTTPDKIHSFIKTNNITFKLQSGTSLSTALSLSSATIIQIKQHKLNIKSNLIQLAIDEYGLVTIDAKYFPQKIDAMFYIGRLRVVNYLIKMVQSQMQQSLGPIRYIARPQIDRIIGNVILQKINKKEQLIVQGSFMHRQLFLGKKYNFTTANKEQTFKLNIFQKWTKLPKILWLYWSNGFDNASPGNQLCVLNLKLNAQAAGFVVNLVSDQNSRLFLSETTLKLLDETIKNSKMSIFPQTKSDLYRLALVSTHGGIYLDASYIAVQNFNWIINIAGEHSSYFFNRYGTVPKVLLQFHPLFGGLLQWTIDQKANTKSQWNLGYQSNLIVADQDSQFVEQWFKTLIFFITNTYDTTQAKMKECGVSDLSWTTHQTNRYLAVMDALKVVVGCKQKMLEQSKQSEFGNAADYYKIWAMNGFTGCQKFRVHSNLAKASMSDDNLFIRRFSIDYVQQILGKTYKLFKFYSEGMKLLNYFIESHASNISSQVHPESIFAIHIYNSSQHQLFQTDKMHAKLIK